MNLSGRLSIKTGRSTTSLGHLSCGKGLLRRVLQETPSCILWRQSGFASHSRMGSKFILSTRVYCMTNHWLLWRPAYLFVVILCLYDYAVKKPTASATATATTTSSTTTATTTTTKYTDAIWRHRIRSTLVQVKACCLSSPSHYPNQCGPITNGVLSHVRTKEQFHMMCSRIYPITMKGRLLF